MLAIRNPLLCLFVALAVCATAAAKPAAKPALKFGFDGTDYVHRSTTTNGRSDFTPASQPGDTWRDRVTIVVRENVTTSDELSSIANNLLATVGDLGEVVRAESAANPRTQETDHFFAARMQASNYTQASFARVALIEGKGMLIVYSHRSYGEHSAESSTGWMDRNGEATERALMAWTGMPKIAQLRALQPSK